MTSPQEATRTIAALERIAVALEEMTKPRVVVVNIPGATITAEQATEIRLALEGGRR